MRKVKVAFFAEILIADFDGAARTMFQLFERIDHERFEFLFICASGPDQIFGFDCLKIPSLRIPFNRNYVIGMPGRAPEGTWEKLDHFAPDLVHIATPSFLGHFALKYARNKSLPVTSIYHTHFVSYIAYYLKYLPFLIKPVESLTRKYQNEFYDQCDKVYIPSTSIAKELVEAGMSPKNMKIWKRGMDTGLFSPGKKDENYLQTLTGNTKPTILFASRLVWEKNLETLISIYELVRSGGLSYNFIVVGDGVARKDCEARMPGAIFPGRLGHEQLSVLYASASVFVFPSVSETFGNVVLEAMASGLVPVVADGGGSRDFIEEGENGYKCSPYEAAAYVEKIREVIENPSLQARLSQNAVQYSQSYDWDELARVYFSDLIALTAPIEKLELEN
ncbi:GDP-mannose-dependent alpha-mannosyltransferase [Dyadobacter sp. CECT 9623]|uniref:GDP-mannose-dependent alpha-mannosyltransferase n=1 Tax=Dyadobacter linearis TaxID=2823330 RepID=A0ABM8UKZ0_9BACT|nr:glycosyltransferase family 1 protein [Dyadobacter sp. CECT 9623]CAG5068161.1 GDP-mannose-dependent alpha-mannosyltransferase [Dyadobacter sp. CECT 9623]